MNFTTPKSLKDPLTPIKGFSLIEMLVAITILAILLALIVPGYLRLRRTTNVQIAQQQAATVQRAIQSWLASFPTLDAADAAFGRGDIMSTTRDVFTGVGNSNSIANYLDSKFMSDIFVGYGLCFTTQAMRDIQGNFSTPTSITIMGTSYSIPAISTPPSTGYAIIFWKDDPVVRRQTMPVVIAVPAQ